MSVQSGTRSVRWSLHPVAVEFGVVAAAFVGLSLWESIVSALDSVIISPAIGGLVPRALVTGVITVAGVALFTAAYGRYRGFGVGSVLPSRESLPLVASTAAVPFLLVGAVKLVGVATGVTYGALTMTAVAADTPLAPILQMLALSLLVAVPVLVLVCQLLVQRSFERALGGDAAVALTTAVAGFALLSDTGGLSVVPERGRLAGVVLFALLLGVAAYANDTVERERLRNLALLPLLVLVGVVVLSGVANVGSVAGALFVVAHLSVLGLAAYSYDRTESLLPPALAYAGLLVANRAVVVLFEAGAQSW